jgi:hypothetical protein
MEGTMFQKSYLNLLMIGSMIVSLPMVADKQGITDAVKDLMTPKKGDDLFTFMPSRLPVAIAIGGEYLYKNRDKIFTSNTGEGILMLGDDFVQKQSFDKGYKESNEVSIEEIKKTMKEDAPLIKAVEDFLVGANDLTEKQTIHERKEAERLGNLSGQIILDGAVAGVFAGGLVLAGVAVYGVVHKLYRWIKERYYSHAEKQKKLSVGGEEEAGHSTTAEKENTEPLEPLMQS